jgi:hypothetical protein
MIIVCYTLNIIMLTFKFKDFLTKWLNAWDSDFLWLWVSNDRWFIGMEFNKLFKKISWLCHKDNVLSWLECTKILKLCVLLTGAMEGFGR